MINNRQNGRRGRGRGGVRPLNGTGGGGNSNPERGNRIDNRARGNASQLHEKYKTLARDAQTQGDRVMAEYYLQFADHYFRVLSESRNRFEEQRRARGDFSEDDGDMDGDGGMDGMDARDQRFDDQPYEQPRYEQRDRQPQQQRDRPRDGDDRPRRDEQPREMRDGNQAGNGNGGNQSGGNQNGAERGNGQPYADQRGTGQQGNAAGQNGREPRVDREPRSDREPRVDRESRPEREPRRERSEPREARPEPEQAAPASVVAEGEAPRRPRGRPRRVVEDAPRLDGLPPAFLSEAISVTRDAPPAAEPAPAAASVAAPAEGEERPRRRVRRPRADESAPVEA